MYKLKHYRNLNNDSYENLSNNIGINIDYLKKWEEGTMYPTLDELEKICSYYNISLDDLLSNKEKEEIYGIKQSKKRTQGNWILAFCIVVISLFTLLGLFFLIQMTINWINGGSFF